ncbi:MAG: hypothetical protein ACJA1A_002123, partial [Saprospiraceae bacterium]
MDFRPYWSKEALSILFMKKRHVFVDSSEIYANYR